MINDCSPDAQSRDGGRIRALLQEGPSPEDIRPSRPRRVLGTVGHGPKGALPLLPPGSILILALPTEIPLCPLCPEASRARVIAH